MTPIFIALFVLASAVAFGRWRKFNAIQWIWTLFGTAFGLLVIWALMLIFVAGPEMRRTVGRDSPANQAERVREGAR